jgi:hypothetical protein
MKRACNTCWILMATVSFLAAADAPYLGKWKLNPAKSQLTGETTSIEQTADGGIRLVNPETSNDFKPDGKEYPTPSGSTIAWKEVSPNNFEVTIRTNGQVVANIRLVLKGDTLAQTAHRKKADGGTSESTVKLARVSGGPGIFGKWKTTDVKAAATLDLVSNGADGLTFKYPDSGDACAGKFDGNDYPVTGPQAAGKTAYTFKKTGPNSFEMTEKLAGKAIYVDTFTLSPDGKTLTDDGTPVSAKEPTKAVYDRQ